MRKLLPSSCLALALGLAACVDQATAPLPAAVASRSTTTSTARALPSVPTDAPLFARGADTHSPAGRLADGAFDTFGSRAINPSDYVCTAGSPLDDWYSAQADRVEAEAPGLLFYLYWNLAADIVPTYEALFFQTTATPQYFGYGGEFTKVLGKTERDVKRFWDIQSEDIQLIGLHGTMLQDPARVAATYEAVFGLSPASSASLAANAQYLVQTYPSLNGGNHPFFSFNAFAYTTNGGAIPDKIVMGDGILEGYAAIGYGDVAPQAIYAHEFGHHIQFENGYFNDPAALAGSPAERTRYTELMSDAFSAYYLTHKRGATMNRKRVGQFLQVFFQIGDCGFGSSGHHGTPNQRMAAARFGFDVADEAQKQGHIMTSEEFHTRFLAVYPSLIAPDAP